MAKDKGDLLQGTLDLLVLKSLQLEPQHGFGIAQRIQQLSSDVLRIEQGSLYPALYRSRSAARSTPTGARPTTTARPSSTR